MSSSSGGYVMPNMSNMSRRAGKGVVPRGSVAQDAGYKAPPAPPKPPFCTSHKIWDKCVLLPEHVRRAYENKAKSDKTGEMSAPHHVAERLRGRTLEAIRGGVIAALNHVHKNMSHDELKAWSHLGSVVPRVGQDDGWKKGWKDPGNWVYSVLVECLRVMSPHAQEHVPHAALELPVTGPSGLNEESQGDRVENFLTKKRVYTNISSYGNTTKAY